MLTGRCSLPCDFGSQPSFISWPFTDSPRAPKGYPWDLFPLLIRSRQCWWLSASVVVLPSHPAQFASSQQNSPHPILCSRPGLMTPLPHSHLLTLLGWDQSWPVSGQQAHVSTPPFPSYSFISASPGCDPMGLPGPLSSLNMVLPAPPSPPSLTTGLAASAEHRSVWLTACFLCVPVVFPGGS